MKVGRRSAAPRAGGASKAAFAFGKPRQSPYLDDVAARMERNFKMDLRSSLVRMLKQLLEDMHALQQLGAGYYSCIPIAKRYNKLMEQAQSLFPGAEGLAGTFEKIEEADPKDPSEKMKVVQGIRIEIGQLITLLESMREEDT